MDSGCKGLLHVAIVSRYAELIALLLRRGAGVDAVDSKGHGPLHS